MIRLDQQYTVCKSTRLGVPKYKELRKYHECQDGTKKSVSRITIWHHEACRVMTNGDREGQIFLSHPHMNNGFFFLLTIKYCILCF